MRWLIAILFLIHIAAFASPPPKMSQLYQKAQTLFSQGKCEQIIALGSKISLSDPVDDVTSLVKTEAIIARCHFQRGETQATESQLRNILFLQPAFELDPFETPPPLLDSFNRIRKELSEKAKELQAVKENAQKQNDVLETEIRIRKMSPLAPFVPFGFPQFEYGAKTKGVIIAAAQVALIGVNVGSFWYKQSLTSPDASNLVADEGALSSYNLAQGIQFASIGVLGAVYLFGIIDGLLHKDDSIEETSHTLSRRISRDEFIQKLNELKTNEESPRS